MTPSERAFGQCQAANQNVVYAYMINQNGVEKDKYFLINVDQKLVQRTT